MSERNYKPSEGPLGAYRKHVETPVHQPEVDIVGLLALQEWRVNSYNKPILDKLLAGYRFEPVDVETAKKYVGGPRSKAVGRQAVLKMLANKDEVIASGQRQIVHIAENTEQMLATFWMVSEARHDAVKTALSGIIQDKPIDASNAFYAAEAIEDMGHCIMEPFEPIWDGNKRKIVPDEVIFGAVEAHAPGVGQQIVQFGKFAADNHNALYTDTGIVLLQSAKEEQEYRIDAWKPRHEVLLTAFPKIEPSMDILLGRVPMEEMLTMQNSF